MDVPRGIFAAKVAGKIRDRVFFHVPLQKHSAPHAPRERAHRIPYSRKNGPTIWCTARAENAKTFRNLVLPQRIVAKWLLWR
jgi:hypothetical protein